MDPEPNRSSINKRNTVQTPTPVATVPQPPLTREEIPDHFMPTTTSQGASGPFQFYPGFIGQGPKPPEPDIFQRMEEYQYSENWLRRAIEKLGFNQVAQPEAQKQAAIGGISWTHKHINEPVAAELTYWVAKYNNLKTHAGDREPIDYSQLPWYAQGFAPPATPDIAELAGSDSLVKFTDLVDKYKLEGLSDSEAKTEAYRNTDFNNHYKGLAETVTDPVGLAMEIAIPGGLLAKPAAMGLRGITKGARTGLHGLEAGASAYGIQPIRNRAIANLTKSELDFWKQAMPTGEITSGNRQTIDKLKRAGLVEEYTENNVSRYAKPAPNDSMYNEVEGIWRERWNPKLGQNVQSGELQTSAIPDMAGGPTRTIGEVFPEGAPRFNLYRQIEDKIDDITKRQADTRVNFEGDPVTLVRRQTVGERTPLNNTAIRSTRATQRPAMIGKQITTWELPSIIPSMERAAQQGKRLALSDNQRSTLAEFLNRYGVDPWSSSDEALGRFEVSPVVGDRQFIVGAFDNPFRPATGGSGKAMTKPYERHYITYSPDSKSFGIQTTIGEKPQLVDIKSGRNVSEEIDNVIKRADDAIIRIEAEMATTPIGSPRYKQLLGQLKATNQRKQHRIAQLQEVDSTLIPEPPRQRIASIDEIEEFNEVWNSLYTDVVNGERIPRGIARSTVVQPDTYVPFTRQTQPGMHFSEWNYDGHFRPVHPNEKMLDSIFLQELNRASNSTVYDAWVVAINKIARKRGLPKPPRPHGVPSTVSKPEDSVGAIDEFFHTRPGKEGTDALAAWYGFRQVAAKELQNWVDEGYKFFREFGIGQNYRNRRILTRVEGEPLLKALHGEGPVPEGMEDLVDHIKGLRDKEQSEYLAFNPGLEDVFASHPDYFPRIWRAPINPKTGERYVFDDKVLSGNVPGHLRPKNDATFTEMLNLGWEPVSWNPVDLMALRRIAGIEHRETMLLLDRLKRAKVAKPVGEADKGWRVPKVGPAFEGSKQFSKKKGGSINTPQYAVPNEMADRLESIWGVNPKMGVIGPTIKRDPSKLFGVSLQTESVDIAPLIRNVATTLKRSILQASGFQHVDFFFRSGAAATSYDGMKRAGLLRMLPLTGRLLAATFYKGDFYGFGRKAIEKRILDGSKLYDDFDITLRMVAENGWSMSGDPSIMRREAISALQDFERNLKVGTPKIVADRIAGAIRFWESGLFDGVYRETQAFMLENMIIPQMRRQFPTESADQIARRAADQVNILSSSLGDWQTVFSSPIMKDVSRAALFSSNEAESWIKATVGTVKGESKQLYQEYWVGYFMFLAGIANAINYSTTGQMLPLASYTPIRLKEQDEHAILPWIPVYNTRFLNPIVGHGREGHPIYMDIVGQADTMFTWILNPKQFISSRSSPLLNLFRPMVSKKTWYGEPLESGLDIAKYTALQNLPIGAWQTAQMFREDSDIIASLIPEAETGIGKTGRAFQIAGLNVRRESSQELLNEMARRAGFDDVPREWNQLLQFPPLKRATPYEQMRNNAPQGDVRLAWQDPNNQDIVEELRYRSETGERRAQEGSQAQVLLKGYDDDRIDREVAIVDGVRNGQIRLGDWYSKHYQPSQLTYINQIAVLDDVYELFKKDKPPKEELPLARFQYYKALDEAKSDTGQIDWDQFSTSITELKENEWNDAQREHIETGIEQKNHSAYHDPWIAKWLTIRDEYKWYFELEDNYFKKIGKYDQLKAYRRAQDYDDYKKNNPEFANIKSYVDDERKKLRESDLKLAELLVVLGKIEVSTYRDILIRSVGQQQ